jgi:hypothetical protein
MKSKKSSKSRNSSKSSKRSRRSKTVVVIPVSPIGILENFGYYSKNKTLTRHKSLAAALRVHKYKDIISRLNAVAIRFKNRDKTITSNIRDDMEWLKQNRSKYEKTT